MMGWIRPDAVFDGNTLWYDRAALVEDGYITQITAVADLPKGCNVLSKKVVLAPGLFDVQVNGGGGVMLNNQPTPDGVRTIALAHRKVGTAFTLPTVITDSQDVMEKAAHAVLDQYGKNGVLGIHIEGPHINHAHKGTHNPAFIRPLDTATLALIETLRTHELPVLLTLAPETAQPGEIAGLSRMGVVVSAGHSAANAQQTENALSEGLRSFTHLFNGMPQMTSRAPGIVGAAINSDAWCGIIADGHHVDDRMLALAIRARPHPDRMVLVSDAMSTIGGPDHFEIYDEVIQVQNGRLINAAGSLAGAHIDLRTSVARLVNHAGVSLRNALAMATNNPRDMMRLPLQPLAGSRLEDLSMIDSAEFSTNLVNSTP
jgi:N-acetylglucosamine-6-phosphate deacetylase